MCPTTLPMIYKGSCLATWVRRGRNQKQLEGSLGRTRGITTAARRGGGCNARRGYTHGSLGGGSEEEAGLSATPLRVSLTLETAVGTASIIRALSPLRGKESKTSAEAGALPSGVARLFAIATIQLEVRQPGILVYHHAAIERGAAGVGRGDDGLREGSGEAAAAGGLFFSALLAERACGTSATPPMIELCRRGTPAAGMTERSAAPLSSTTMRVCPGSAHNLASSGFDAELEAHTAALKAESQQGIVVGRIPRPASPPGPSSAQRVSRLDPRSESALLRQPFAKPSPSPRRSCSVARATPTPSTLRAHQPLAALGPCGRAPPHASLEAPGDPLGPHWPGRRFAARSASTLVLAFSSIRNEASPVHLPLTI
jgi:hypothetical protein